MSRAALTADALRAAVHYDPESGVFTRLVARGNRSAGAVAGAPATRGYVRFFLNGATYSAHRLAWLYMTGEWPKGDVDHRDGDTGNNRWSNLRDVSKSVNLQNQRRPRRDNKTGHLGVSPHKEGGFVAQIRVAGQHKYLGLFRTPELASAAYLEAKRSLHEGNTL